MSIYDEMQGIASDLLTEFKQGALVYIQMVPVGTGTPDDPAEPISVSHPFNGVVRPVSTKYVDGTHIVQTDKQLTMPANVTVPDMDGFVDIDGSRHKIVQIHTLPAAGTTVAYRLFVRR